MLKPQTFCVKEEPQSEGPLSPRLQQAQPSYVFCPERAALTPEGPLKAREGSPLAKSSILSQDISVKVASELLMKLSGTTRERLLSPKPLHARINPYTSREEHVFNAAKRVEPQF